ncbi:MAG: shikimate dehydrogenase [Legionellales bacterium]|nr:shikimate dehydrogenase [Legionellales bacterium]
MINKDTKLCISIASRPSNFGTTLHNEAYAAMGLNFIYKAFVTEDVSGVITGLKALGIRGCSVSMPFKISVMSYLDGLDEAAEIIGAVNTIVNNQGKLTGYNTDVIGARLALESLQIRANETVLLLGAGGVARAILFALSQLGCTQVRVANRDDKKALQLNSILPCRVVPWTEKQNEPVDVIINATSIGMSPNENVMPVDEAFIKQSRAVMDVVNSPMETELIQCAYLAGKAVAPGYLMSLEQVIAQFKLYTGVEPPREVMMQSIRQLLKQ